MKSILFVAALSCVVVFSSQASASMRCGTHVVQLNDTTFQLLNKCGRPNFMDGEQWIYGSQSRQSRIVRIRRGKVWSITEGRSRATNG
jgi:hypothetical protein